MNDHSLDDLIIGDPVPSGKKSKSFLVIIALLVIILLIGILLSKMILGTSEETIMTAEENQTEYVSPELIPIGSGTAKSPNDLEPIGQEKLPSATKPKVKPVKKPVVKTRPKKPVPQKPRHKKPVVKKPVPKRETVKQQTKPKQTSTKPAKASALFGKGKPVYYIQIGAFNREPNPKFLNKIENAGLKYVVNKNEKTRRVRVGPYGSYAEAKAALTDVNGSIGIMGFVVKQK